MAWTLVTGAAKGLGKAIALELAKRGHNVVLHYHTSESQALEVVERCLAEGVKAEALAGDFSSKEGVQEFIKNYQSRFSATRYLVHNVGAYATDSLLTIPLERWEALYHTNLISPFLLMRGLLDSLSEEKGAIIALGTAGIIFPRANLYSGAYNLIKHSLWSLVRGLAKELAPKEVRVNMVSPGQTESSVDLWEDSARFPMKRPATLKEVVSAVVFLLDEENCYITGQNLEVSGGVRL